MRQKVINLLNEARSRELNAINQYMIHHYELEDKDFGKLASKIKEIAIAEMKHAEKLAERLNYLNGVPGIKPDPIFVGGSLIEMLKQDEQDEEESIVLYRRAIQVASEEGDFTTRCLLEEILSEEETHIDTFGKLLVGMTSPFTQPGL